MGLRLPQPLHHVLAPKLPKVRSLATASDTSDLTTYTFTGMDIGGFGGGTPFGTHETAPNVIPLLAASSKKIILAIIHGEDAATTFGVNSVTIGGVSGVELIDRGGTTSAINTAIYGWDEQALAGIANTDVVVTWSEAITCCAVGIIEVSGLRLYSAAGAPGTGSAQGTGNINVDISGSALHSVIGGVVILGSTCETGGGTETVTFGFNTAGGTGGDDGFRPITLYEENNAEIDFAAAYFLLPSYTGSGLIATGVRTQVFAAWSGAGAGDAAGIFLY